MESIFILYVKNQQASRDFYCKVFLQEPVLDVPGMTEFLISENTKLGLMPEAGIAQILHPKTPDPASGNGIPRCEIYLYSNEPEAFLQRAIYAGAKNISEFQKRSWKDFAGYVSDPDGHILAFAKKP